MTGTDRWGHIMPLRRGLLQKNMPASAPRPRKVPTPDDIAAGYVKWYYFHQSGMTYGRIAELVERPYNFVRNIIELNYHAKAPMLRPPKAP